MMPPLTLSIISIIIISVYGEDPIGNRDTYLNAYKVSHSLNSHIVGKTDRQSSYFPDKNEYPYPVYNKPAEDYGSPKDNYDVPKNVYGPPQNTYGPPKPVYGPPSYNYNPHGSSYGAPEPFYGMPHSMLGILDKIKLKLDLFTIGKIILKLVIFKKIVSLIAILCLLLFIPSLKHHDKEQDSHHDNDDDEMRMIKSNTADDHINRITSLVADSIDKFARLNETYYEIKCTSVYCKSTKLISYLEKNFTDDRLIDLYMKEKER